MRIKKQILSLTLAAIMLASLTVPSFADSGKWNNGNDKGNKITSEEKKQGPPSFVIKKHELKGFSFMDGKKIKANREGLEFDVQPVIKEGRTLIPVRAITEAMGAKVEYTSETGIVTITSEDGLIVILFYLNEDDNGKVTVTKDGATTDVTTDVRPGIINNRTFVPLRFIAETLGLKVTHDPNTGNTDIDKDVQTLKLTPTHFDFANRVVLADVKLAYSMDAEYDLVSIKNGSFLLNSTQYTTSSNTITILKDYVEDLTVDKTTLTLTFKNTKDVSVEKTFEININQDGVYEAPTLDKQGVKFFSASEIADVVITMDLNDHILKQVLNGSTVLSAGAAYTLSDNKITLKKSYIDALAAGETVLTLVFEASDKELVNVTFKIEK